MAAAAAAAAAKATPGDDNMTSGFF